MNTDKKATTAKLADPPKEGDIRVTINIVQSGFVNFGPYSTKNFQFIGDFRKGSNINLAAEPAANHKFLSWSSKIGDKTNFVSDQLSATIQNARHNMIIIAEFTPEF